MPDFTEGRWVFSEGKICVSTFDSNGDVERTIAEVYADMPTIEFEANGRLIANAPKMYWLLKVLSNVDAPMGEDRFDDLLLAVDEARKVLARIDGKEANDE